MKRKTSLLSLAAAVWVLAAVVLLLVFGGGSPIVPVISSPSPGLTPALDTLTPTTTPAATPAPSTPPPTPERALPVAGEYYYDLENVILYLELYDTLPDNYLTKQEAKNLGWTGGSVEPYRKEGAIGGDRFGNREGLLPIANGRSYTECDLNTLGQNTRGSQRLCFSNDGLYFYTGDHYEHFTQYVITSDWEVLPQ